MHGPNPYAPEPPPPRWPSPGPGAAPYPDRTPRGETNVLHWVLGIAGVGFVVLVGLALAVTFHLTGGRPRSASISPTPTYVPGHGPAGTPHATPPAEEDEDDEAQDEDEDDDEESSLPPPPPRAIPRHDVRMLTGCSDAELRSVLGKLDAAVATGAPRYNRGDFQGSFQTYLRTALDIESALPLGCRGPADAMRAGRERAAKLPAPSDRAWAMRDAIDGLIEVIERKGPGL